MLKTWNSDSIDKFHAVKRREEFVMTGIGSVREPRITDPLTSRIFCNVDRGTIRVTNWAGTVLYVGTKD